MFSAEIVDALKDAGLSPRLDPSITGDIMLPNGVGIRIITTGDAECWDNDVTREELQGVSTPVLAVWHDHASTENKMVVDCLKDLSGQIGVRVESFSNPIALVSMIKKIIAS